MITYPGFITDLKSSWIKILFGRKMGQNPRNNPADKYNRTMEEMVDFHFKFEHENTKHFVKKFH